MINLRRLGNGPAAWLLLVPLSVALGCKDRPPIQPATSKPATPATAINLTVLVAGDAELAEGVRLLRGEWKARSGGELTVETLTTDNLGSSDAPKGDVIIFPSRWLGVLAEKSSLRAVRPSVLESSELSLSDILPAIRNGEMRYGGQTLALPLGSPPLLLYARAPSETGPQTAKELPATWERFQTTAESASDADRVVLPLADRAAAFTLIARALAHIEPSYRHEAIFNPDDMSPRIAEPPFVRALAEIRAALGDEAQTPVDFQAAVKSVRGGRAFATLGWPSLVKATTDEAGPPTTPAEFWPLPTARQVFIANQQRWENQAGGTSVTLLGIEGRLAAVTQSSRNAVTAFKLCQWLTSGDIAIQLSSRSTGTLWFRKSQAAAYGRWVGGEASAGSIPVTKLVAESLATETPVMIPRVPGIDEYLNALAEAVRSADAGEEAAKAALSAAAAKWEAITERLGRDAQAQAYRRHLSLETIGDAR